MSKYKKIKKRKKWMEIKMMNTTNTIRDIGKEYILELELCTTMIELDEFLKKNNCITLKEQVEFLKEYMCVLYEAAWEEEIKKEEYEEECKALKEMFLDGRWRQMSDKYDSIKLFD